VKHTYSPNKVMLLFKASIIHANYIPTGGGHPPPSKTSTFARFQERSLSVNTITTLPRQPAFDFEGRCSLPSPTSPFTSLCDSTITTHPQQPALVFEGGCCLPSPTSSFTLKTSTVARFQERSLSVNTTVTIHLENEPVCLFSRAVTLCQHPLWNPGGGKLQP
jgi:hypothetical protein